MALCENSYMRRIFIIFGLLFVGISVNEFTGVLKHQHPHDGLNVTELVRVFNYTIESHEVITQDGYIVTLHRLPYKGDSADDVNKCRIPVLMLPGYLNSAADFLCLGPNKSLAYFLVDAGYDVWIGNYRGTLYSRKHITLDPDIDEEFWNFATDEIGVYDLSAMVDYILKNTMAPKVHCITISQGALLSIVLMSERPQYNDKIHSMSMVAPGVFLPETRCLACLFLASIHRQIHEDLSVIYSNMPAGTSSKQVANHGQLIWTGIVSKYDYGYEENLVLYGQQTPPPYILSRMTVPVAIYYSTGDVVTPPKGIKQLAETLPNVVHMHPARDSEYSHSDFLYGRDLWSNYVHEMIDVMNKY